MGQHLHKLNLGEVTQTSQNFIHFLCIAEDMVHRIDNLDRDFFEGEEEFKAVLESFHNKLIINEAEYYDLLGKPFENSVYFLLKKLYLDGYFSGDITRVRKVQQILKSLAEYIMPVDIDEIKTYFKDRFDALLLKEASGNILHYVVSVIQIIREGKINEESQIIWEMIDIAYKYDSSGFLLKLFGLGNKPALASHECLHFLLMNGFLDTQPEIKSGVYITLREYYLGLGVQERLDELDLRKDDIGIFTLIPKSIQQAFYGNENKDIKITRHIVNESKRIYRQVYLGIFDDLCQHQFGDFLVFIYDENIISEEEYDVAMQAVEDVTSVFYILDILLKLGYFREDITFVNQIKHSINSYELLLKEEDELFFSPELNHEEIENTILNTTELMLVFLETGEHKELELCLYDFIDFLLENKIFTSMMHDTDATNVIELAHDCIEKLENAGYYKDYPENQEHVSTYLSQFHNE